MGPNDPVSAGIHTTYVRCSPGTRHTGVGDRGSSDAVIRPSSLAASKPCGCSCIRAGILLLDAHWEGIIKNSSCAYLNFVNCQGLSYKQFSSYFVEFGVKKLLAYLIESRKYKTDIVAVEFFVNRMDENANLSLNQAVDTESNLKTHVFENIVLSLGIDTRPYGSRYNLIDESLVWRSNEIAHGEYVDLNSDQ